MNDRRRDDDDDDAAMLGRMHGYGRNERMPSRDPVHTSMDYIERVAAMAAKAAVEAETKNLESALETAVVKAETRLLERLGIANTEEGFTQFRKNQEWAKNQRELRALVVKAGIGAIVLAVISVAGSAFVLWLQSKAGGK